jgi:hypothetical protein
MAPAFGRFIAERARDRKPPARPEGLASGPAFCLFLIGDVLQHEAGQLCHQRPQPGIFFQKADHAGIEITIKAVFIAKPRRCNAVALGGRRVQISHDKHPSTDKEPRRVRINFNCCNAIYW